jgi:type IV secretory pathway VirJ component
MKTILLAVALALLGTGRLAAQTTTYETGLMDRPEMVMPDKTATSLVFLLSGRDGWNDGDRATAKELARQGAAVVGIDLPRYLARIEAQDRDCAYLVSDIESVGHQILRSLKTDAYLAPIVAGRDEGGTLALAMAAQTPPATIGRILAVNPTRVTPLSIPLCTPARREAVDGGAVYGLSPGSLPSPVDAVFTPDASDAGRQHVAELKKAGFAITAIDQDGTVQEALLNQIDAVITAPVAEGSLEDLPVVELAATPRFDTMAIVLSGDGGWRDLDKTIAEDFQEHGMPTVGLDALRYFWSEKTPEQTAKDLSRIIAAYTAKWRVRHILLVGYSFGADVLPATVAALPEEDRSRVAQISLLGLAKATSFEIAVSGWLGVANTEGRPILEDARKLVAADVQCFYGRDEAEGSLCPELQALGMDVIVTDGGHHFDGDYEALSKRMLNGLAHRIGMEGLARR